MSSPAPDDIGHALPTLADADANTGDRPESRLPAAVVAEAHNTSRSLSAAARSLSGGGELTLRRAVGEVARRGHHDHARRGQSLLADLDRLHVALADADVTEAPNRSSRAAEGRPWDTDYSHSGRTTVFSGGDGPSDR